MLNRNTNDNEKYNQGLLAICVIPVLASEDRQDSICESRIIWSYKSY